jgi:hypothetical protein
LGTKREALTDLYVSGNHHIDDDAIHALALLQKLFFLSIEMAGVR